MTRNLKLLIGCVVLILAIIFSVIIQSGWTQTGQEYIRIRIDVAIPKATWDGLIQTQKDAARNKLLESKALARKINAGKVSEENTVSVKYHLCRHELGLPCPKDEDF